MLSCDVSILTNHPIIVNTFLVKKYNFFHILQVILQIVYTNIYFSCSSKYSAYSIHSIQLKHRVDLRLCVCRCASVSLRHYLPTDRIPTQKNALNGVIPAERFSQLFFQSLYFDFASVRQRTGCFSQLVL